MARRKKFKEGDFPKPGTVYSMPLEDGRVGACRVLRFGTELGAPAVLVAVSPWIDHSPPGIDSPKVRKTIRLNHHNHTGDW